MLNNLRQYTPHGYPDEGLGIVDETHAQGYSMSMALLNDISCIHNLIPTSLLEWKPACSSAIS